MTGYTIFDTAIGPCAMAWTAAGISGVQLPDADAPATARRMPQCIGARRDAPPPDGARRAIADIQNLLEGHGTDLTHVVLDFARVPAFDRRVFKATRLIPPGQTRTYGAIAAGLGDAALARAVGQALGRNPFAIVVPCHRVLAAHGRIGGFSAPGGASAKQRMLLIERARPGDEPGLFDAL